MTNDYAAIERAVGLHQSLRVIYVVDGYEAEIETESGAIIASARGETIGQALAALDGALPHPNPEGL